MHDLVNTCAIHIKVHLIRSVEYCLPTYSLVHNIVKTLHRQGTLMSIYTHNYIIYVQTLNNNFEVAISFQTSYYAVKLISLSWSYTMVDMFFCCLKKKKKKSFLYICFCYIFFSWSDSNCWNIRTSQSYTSTWVQFHQFPFSHFSFCHTHARRHLNKLQYVSSQYLWITAGYGNCQLIGGNLLLSCISVTGVYTWAGIKCLLSLQV